MWPLLTVGRCSEVGFCYKDPNWDYEMVVAIDRWLLFVGGMVVSLGLTVPMFAKTIIIVFYSVCGTITFNCIELLVYREVQFAISFGTRNATPQPLGARS